MRRRPIGMLLLCLLTTIATSFANTDLDSLINEVQQDSLQSHTEHLQSLGPRGMCDNFDSRQWLLNKLTGFGYDSVFIDSFSLGVFGCQSSGGWPANVIAVKEGSTHPHHQIIIGANFDSDYDSPGADANGSGTAAVLEIARVLEDFDSRMTLVFMLFDGGLAGHLGAWRHTNTTAAYQDSIVLMLDLDQIGAIGNYSQARINHGDNATYAELWAHLADSLTGVNINASLSAGEANSDYFPFRYNGHNTIFIHEYTVSTVANSPNDSTVYLNFDYLARMTKATLATVVSAVDEYAYSPTLTVTYPDGVPEMTLPGRSRTFPVQIDGYGGGSVVPGSAMLYYALPLGWFEAVPMTDLGGGLYEASIPPLTLFDRVQFYIKADEASRGEATFSDGGRNFTAVCAYRIDTVLFDPMEYDYSWWHGGDAEEGWFECGVIASQYVTGGTMPPCDIYGHGRTWVTGLQGTEDVDNGHTTLTSPTLDLTAGEAGVEYYRWFINSVTPGDGEDVMVVSLTDDWGATWTTVKTLGPVSGTTPGWKYDFIWISDFVDLTDQVRLRFDISDLGMDSQVEGGIDHFTFVTYAADSSGPQIEALTLPDWTAGVPYARQLRASGGVGRLLWTDLEGDLDGSGLSLSVNGLFSGVPALPGAIGFTAEVTDEFGQADSMVFGFAVNSSLAVETIVLPDAEYGRYYTTQLACSGGTGNIVWSDVDESLTGSGLTLTPDGLLSGTIADTGSFAFTVRIQDEVGGFVVQPLNLISNVICGDIDASGGDPDISDLTYLVDYFFGGGPPPPDMTSADVNASGSLDISDLTYLVDYLFGGGPAPAC